MAVPANVSFALHRIVGADAGDLLDWMNSVEANRSELSELVTVYSSEARMHTDLRSAELRREMAELRSELKVEMAELKGEMGKLKGEMGKLRAELNEEMADLRGELKGEIAELRGDMRAGFAAIDTRFAKQDAAFGQLMQTRSAGWSACGPPAPWRLS